jgi:YHS domain-containing protein
MKTKATLLVLALATALVLPQLTAQDKDKLKGAKCPVAGTKAAKAESSADYRGAKVYFCCDNCPKAFAKDTAKHATKANHQLAQTGQAKQEKCPLSGDAIDKEQTVEISGVKVSFCCGNCKGKAEKAEGDAKIELAFADKAFDKGFKVEKKK